MAPTVIICPSCNQDNTTLPGCGRNVQKPPFLHIVVSDHATKVSAPSPRPIQHFLGYGRPTCVTNMQVVPSSRNYAYYQAKISTSQNPLGCQGYGQAEEKDI